MFDTSSQTSFMMLIQAHYYYAILTFSLSVVSNISLLLLLIIHPNKKIGNYRYLMCSFSLLGLFFSTIDMLNKPMVHITGGVYIIFTLNELNLPRRFAQYLNALNCSCYAMTVSLLATHFIYRYLAVCRPHRMNLFTWPYSIIWLVFCFFISFEWWLTAVLFAAETQEINEIVKPSMEMNYNLTLQQFVYAGNLYYRTNKLTGEKHISWADLLYALNVVKLIAICFTIVFVCGITTFQKMRSLTYTSKKTNDLQRQLFHALIVQTFIPMLTMFLPAGVLMFCPLFEVTLGSVEGLILTVITTYPCLDPIVVIYFVRDYRIAVYAVIRCKKNDIVQKRVSFRANTVISHTASNNPVLGF